MKEELEGLIQATVKSLFGTEIDIELTRPEEQFGDYAANVSLQLSQQLKKSPHEIAEKLADQLKKDLAKQVSEVSVAGPGFINLKLSDKSLLKALKVEPDQKLVGKVVVAEYSDPNPFKVLHAGHLYTSVVGDSIANLLESAGATVHRVNFGGDVGLHVAKTLWAIEHELKGDLPQKFNDESIEKRAAWMAECYAKGNTAYDEDNEAKEAITKLNQQVYEIHARHDYTSYIAQVYWMCREWSYEYFNKFYERLGIKFEKYYPESETADIGLKVVRKHIGTVFEESEGAVVFKGEAHDLHTRVFINSQGLPTYEAKDVGLIMKKWEEYHFDRSIVITGNEQMQYMQVVLKAIEQFAPELAQASTHLTHGIVKLQGGKKMSSRSGQVLLAEDVLDVAARANQKLTGKANEQTTLGAVKYAFLKQRLGGDIIYDPEESVSLEGNSGPYLQYAHARARSILAKVKTADLESKVSDLEANERSLARKISEYPEVVNKAVAELMPHHVCTYLYELAQNFNRFYEKNRVIGDDRQNTRLTLIDHYAKTLKQGLELLGIKAPERI